MTIFLWICVGVVCAIYMFVGLSAVANTRKGLFRSILIFLLWPLIVLTDWLDAGEYR